MNRRTVGLAAGLTVLAAILRLNGLGRQSLWTDEMHTVALAGVPYGTDQPVWRLKDLLEVTQGPFFMALVHGWSALFGTGETALRLLPALFAIATVPVFLALAMRLLDSRAAAFATLLLAVSPFHIWYAQELRGYSLVILAAVVATWLLLRLINHGDERGDERGGRRGGDRNSLRFWDHLFYGASLLVGLGASLTMVFMLVLHALVIAVRARTLGPRRIVALAAVFVVVAAATTPWLGVFGRRHDVSRAIAEPRVVEPPLRGPSTMPPLAIPYAFYAFSAGFSLGPSLEELHTAPAAAVRRHLPVILAVALVYGGLGFVGMRGLRTRRPGTGLLLLAWIVVPFALAGWMAATNVKVWNARYVAVAFPAYLLVVGAGLAALADRRRILACALALGLALLAVGNLRFDPDYAKEDYRSAGAYLNRTLDSADVLIAVGAPGPLFYYTERPAHYLLVHPHRIGDEALLRQRLQVATGGRPRAWLFRTRAYQSDPGNRVGAILGETRKPAESLSFHGIELVRYDRAAETSETVRK